MNIKFAKLRPDAIIPTKRYEDMGFDIYACFDEDYFLIPPHNTRLVPTGIASVIEQGFGIVLKERGSTGSKGIALRCGVIDSGYRGEWFVGITNTTDQMLIISKNPDKNDARHEVLGFEDHKSIVYPYEKAIAQAVVLPVPECHVSEITHEELQQFGSERGDGALGASGK